MADTLIPGRRSCYTLLVYLSDCTGGETAFFPRPGQRATASSLVVSPRVGTALLHRQGPHCLLHEGRPVTCGDKWLLRSDVMYAY